MTDDQGQGQTTPDAGGGTTPPADPPAAPPAPASPPPVVTPTGPKGQFTQEDLNKVAGNARAEARERALADFAKDLGVASPEDLKTAIQSQREAEEARMGELEKLQKTHEKVAKERDAVAEQLAEAQQRVTAMAHANALHVGLIEAGVNPERVVAASRLVETDGLEVQDDGTVKGVEEAIEAAKGLAPELFQTAPKSVGGPSNPGGEPPDIATTAWDLTQEQFEDVKRRAQLGDAPVSYGIRR